MLAIDHDFSAGRAPAETVWIARANLLACYQHFLGHDLPNRLIGAQGLARILLADADVPAAAALRPLLERLADLIRHTDEEVRQLATLGRLVRDVEARTHIDLGELCREAAAEAQFLCMEREIGYHIAENLPSAAVSANLARALLVQALRLATAARLPGKTLRVDLDAETIGDDVRFHIRHDGTHMTEEQLGILAELWNDGVADHAALGPGWLFVRHLVAACGGAIAVRSGPQEGTMVRLTLREPPNGRGPMR